MKKIEVYFTNKGEVAEVFEAATVAEAWADAQDCMADYWAEDIAEKFDGDFEAWKEAVGLDYIVID